MFSFFFVSFSCKDVSIQEITTTVSPYLLTRVYAEKIFRNGYVIALICRGNLAKTELFETFCVSKPKLIFGLKPKVVLMNGIAPKRLISK